MGIRVPQKRIETLPMGEYVAAIKSLDVEVQDFGRGPQEQVRFFFACQMPEGTPVDVPGWCSLTFSNRSKLYAWTGAAFMGKEIPAEYTFDSDDLLGRQVILVLTVEEREDGSDFNRVHRVKPVGGELAKAQPALPF